MTRLPLPDTEEIASDTEDLLDAVDVGNLNILKAMGNNPRLMVAVEEYTSALYEELDTRDRELAILTVARTLDSRYEWHQHAQVALAEGISENTVRAIGANDLDGLSDKERAIVEYVRSFCRREVTDNQHEALALHFDDKEIVGICLLTGTYAGFANFISATEIPPENEFVGWTLEE